MIFGTRQPPRPQQAGQPGDYFVTLRRSPRRYTVLSEVQGPHPDQIRFTPMGQTVVNAWFELGRRVDTVRPGPILIMPDHIHALLTLLPAKGILPPPPPAEDLLEQFRADSTHAVNRAARTMGQPLWEGDTLFRLLADEQEKEQAYQYMVADPARWLEEQKA